MDKDSKHPPLTTNSDQSLKQTESTIEQVPHSEYTETNVSSLPIGSKEDNTNMAKKRKIDHAEQLKATTMKSTYVQELENKIAVLQKTISINKLLTIPASSINEGLLDKINANAYIVAQELEVATSSKNAAEEAINLVPQIEKVSKAVKEISGDVLELVRNEVKVIEGASGCRYSKQKELVKRLMDVVVFFSTRMDEIKFRLIKLVERLKSVAGPFSTEMDEIKFRLINKTNALHEFIFLAAQAKGEIHATLPYGIADNTLFKYSGKYFEANMKGREVIGFIKYIGTELFNINTVGLEMMEATHIEEVSRDLEHEGDREHYVIVYDGDNKEHFVIQEEKLTEDEGKISVVLVDQDTFYSRVQNATNIVSYKISEEGKVDAMIGRVTESSAFSRWCETDIWRDNRVQNEKIIGRWSSILDEKNRGVCNLQNARGCWERLVATNGYYSNKLGLIRRYSELREEHNEEHHELLITSSLMAAWIAVAKTARLLCEHGMINCKDGRIIIPETWLHLVNNIGNTEPIQLEVWRKNRFRLWAVA